MHLSKFEKIIIVLILVLGLLGGVLLVFLKQPPIVSSVFIAMGIATLVYHFLGGIESAELSTGVVKLGGSMAALVGSAILINNILVKQLVNPAEELKINKNYQVLNNNDDILGKVSLANFSGKIDKDKHIIIKKDSGTTAQEVKLGKLNLGKLTLNENHNIVAGNDNINLGDISNWKGVVDALCGNIKYMSYCEVKHNKISGAPSKYEIDTDEKYWSPINNYENLYKKLPFKVEPFVDKEGIKMTRIKFDSDTIKERTFILDRNVGELIVDEHEQVLYLVKVRQWNWKEFVQYQVLTLKMQE